MREYMKNIAYSLSKNDQNIDKKISDYVTFNLFRNLNSRVSTNKKKMILMFLSYQGTKNTTKNLNILLKEKLVSNLQNWIIAYLFQYKTGQSKLGAIIKSTISRSLVSFKVNQL